MSTPNNDNINKNQRSIIKNRKKNTNAKTNHERASSSMTALMEKFDVYQQTIPSVLSVIKDIVPQFQDSALGKNLCQVYNKQLDVFTRTSTLINSIYRGFNERLDDLPTEMSVNLIRHLLTVYSVLAQNLQEFQNEIKTRIKAASITQSKGKIVDKSLQYIAVMKLKQLVNRTERNLEVIKGNVGRFGLKGEREGRVILAFVDKCGEELKNIVDLVNGIEGDLEQKMESCCDRPKDMVHLNVRLGGKPVVVKLKKDIKMQTEYKKEEYWMSLKSKLRRISKHSMVDTSENESARPTRSDQRFGKQRIQKKLTLEELRRVSISPESSRKSETSIHNPSIQTQMDKSKLSLKISRHFSLTSFGNRPEIEDNRMNTMSETKIRPRSSLRGDGCEEELKVVKEQQNSATKTSIGMNNYTVAYSCPLKKIFLRRRWMSSNKKKVRAGGTARCFCPDYVVAKKECKCPDKSQSSTSSSYGSSKTSYEPSREYWFEIKHTVQHKPCVKKVSFIQGDESRSIETSEESYEERCYCDRSWKTSPGSSEDLTLQSSVATFQQSPQGSYHEVQHQTLEGRHIPQSTPEEFYQQTSQEPYHVTTQEFYQQTPQDSYYGPPQELYQQIPQDSYHRPPQKLYQQTPQESYHGSSQGLYQQIPQESYHGPPREFYQQTSQECLIKLIQKTPQESYYEQTSQESYHEPPQGLYEETPQESYHEPPQGSYQQARQEVLVQTDSSQELFSRAPHSYRSVGQYFGPEPVYYDTVACQKNSLISIKFRVSQEDVCSVDLLESTDHEPPQRSYQLTPQESYQPSPQASYQQLAQGSYQQSPQEFYRPSPQASYQQLAQEPYQKSPQESYHETPQVSYRSSPQASYQQLAQGSYQQSPQELYLKIPQESYRPSPQDSYRPSLQASYQQLAQGSYKKSPQVPFHESLPKTDSLVTLKVRVSQQGIFPVDLIESADHGPPQRSNRPSPQESYQNLAQGSYPKSSQESYHKTAQECYRQSPTVSFHELPLRTQTPQESYHEQSHGLYQQSEESYHEPSQGFYQQTLQESYHEPLQQFHQQTPKEPYHKTSQQSPEVSFHGPPSYHELPQQPLEMSFHDPPSYHELPLKSHQQTPQTTYYESPPQIYHVNLTPPVSSPETSSKLIQQTHQGSYHEFTNELHQRINSMHELYQRTPQECFHETPQGSNEPHQEAFYKTPQESYHEPLQEFFSNTSKGSHHESHLSQTQVPEQFQIVDRVASKTFEDPKIVQFCPVEAERFKKQLTNLQQTPSQLSFLTKFSQVPCPRLFPYKMPCPRSFPPLCQSGLQRTSCTRSSIGRIPQVPCSRLFPYKVPSNRSSPPRQPSRQGTAHSRKSIEQIPQIPCPRPFSCRVRNPRSQPVQQCPFASEGEPCPRASRQYARYPKVTHPRTRSPKLFCKQSPTIPCPHFNGKPCPHQRTPSPQRNFPRTPSPQTASQLTPSPSRPPSPRTNERIKLSSEKSTRIPVSQFEGPCPQLTSQRTRSPRRTPPRIPSPLPTPQRIKRPILSCKQSSQIPCPPSAENSCPHSIRQGKPYPRSTRLTSRSSLQHVSPLSSPQILNPQEGTVCCQCSRLLKPYPGSLKPPTLRSSLQQINPLSAPQIPYPQSERKSSRQRKPSVRSPKRITSRSSLQHVASPQRTLAGECPNECPLTCPKPYQFFPKVKWEEKPKPRICATCNIYGVCCTCPREPRVPSELSCNAKYPYFPSLQSLPLTEPIKNIVEYSQPGLIPFPSDSEGGSSTKFYAPCGWCPGRQKIPELPDPEKIQRRMETLASNVYEHMVPSPNEMHFDDGRYYPSEAVPRKNFDWEGETPSFVRLDCPASTQIYFKEPDSGYTEEGKCPNCCSCSNSSDSQVSVYNNVLQEPEIRTNQFTNNHSCPAQLCSVGFRAGGIAANEIAIMYGANFKNPPHFRPDLSCFRLCERIVPNTNKEHLN